MDNVNIADLFTILSPVSDERARRLLAAGAAKLLGPGNISRISLATGVSRRAIYLALSELDSSDRVPSTRTRRPGGGRRSLAHENLTLLPDLESLMEPFIPMPQPALRWTTKGVRRLSRELEEIGHSVSHSSVSVLLKELGYTFRSNPGHPYSPQPRNRTGQFSHINIKVSERIKAGRPVIWVDSKIDYRDYPTELRPNTSFGREPVANDRDAPSCNFCSDPPDFVLTRNQQALIPSHYLQLLTLSLGCVRHWWRSTGSASYPTAEDLLIIADGGGMNGPITRFWKNDLQELANSINIPIAFCQFPVGTYKWTRANSQFVTHHRFPAKRGSAVQFFVELSLLGASIQTELQPASDVELIEIIKNEIDPTRIPDEKFEQIKILRDAYMRDWNYVVLPTT